MSNISVISWKALQQTITMADQIFDIVRVVDPLKMCEVAIDEEGNLVDQEDAPCYCIWKFESRCTNCSSLCAMNQECTVSKTEKMGRQAYNVLSNVVIVTDKNQQERKLVVEMLSVTLQEDDSNRDSILIVDDQNVNRMIIRKILEKDYRILEAGDGKEALDILEEEYEGVSAVVLDLVMPGFDGYTTMRFMKNDTRFSNIPILVTTGDVDWKTERKCLEAGAWDFIPKPVNRDTLKLRLKNIIGRSQFDYQKYEQYMAEHDRLTGLYNRSKFFDEIRNVLRYQEGEEYVFLRVDLDRFRLYNSFFGEAEGDRLLIYLANILKENEEEFDNMIIGRIDADIFGIFCLYDADKIACLDQRIAGKLKEYNDAYYIEPSMGVYLVGDTGLPVESMYDRASMAAESCKHKYMSNIGYYDETMAHRLVNEQEVMNEAQRALEEEHFDVYFQPKVNIVTEEMVGAEALCRWVHPEKGMIMPGKFISVFENNGFIGRLDYYMWESTCKYLRKWMDEGIEPVPVSVNVSRANLYNLNLVDMLLEMLEKYDIPARYLQLELTESAFMDDQDMMIEKVRQLQDNGFTVLMDDFGSGYSSLNTLKDIPVDILKVDMKFLGNGAGDGRSERILASIVRMADWLDLEVVVEGVESAEQRNFLESIGCEFAQGYFYSKPMPWQEYEELLRSLKEHPKGEMLKEGNHGVVEELWRTSEEMEHMFYNISQPVALYQFDGREITFLKGNGEFGQFVGHGENAERYFERNNKFIPDNYMTNIRGAFHECAASRKIISCDYLRIDENGSDHWYRIRMQYLTKREESHIILVLFRDVHEEKILEQEVRRYKIFAQEKKSRAKMLIVDDSGISRFVSKELFKDRFDILEAENGEEALKKLRQYHKETAIILLDMNMPVMDGKEFLKIKNATEEFEDIPVVVISSDDKQEHQIDMLRNGVNDYVLKPFVPEVVERRVLNVIEYNSRFRTLLKEYQQSAFLGKIEQNGE